MTTGRRATGAGVPVLRNRPGHCVLCGISRQLSGSWLRDVCVSFVHFCQQFRRHVRTHANKFSIWCVSHGGPDGAQTFSRRRRPSFPWGVGRARIFSRGCRAPARHGFRLGSFADHQRKATIQLHSCGAENRPDSPSGAALPAMTLPRSLAATFNSNTVACSPSTTLTETASGMSTRAFAMSSTNCFTPAASFTATWYVRDRDPK
jgi:hypothetical protein